jgi:hypothetical protein
MYFKGQGVARDYIEALRLWRLAAEQGLAKAQHNLGLMYFNGEGAPQDYDEAVRLYRIAAEEGYAQAQNDLGNMYHPTRVCSPIVNSTTLLTRLPNGVRRYHANFR